ncbi:MAG: acetyl/propionyl-CoA carboxylase alpha subunit, partial [Myxococcota bacterium]
MDRILIANRGEIACRIIRTCHDMGIGTVAVYSDADRNARFVREADVAVHIGPAESSASYLRTEAILDAARQTGAAGIHPGYGFLSENAGFAQACADAEIVFIGPGVDAIKAMGSKIAAKALMGSHGVPVVPGFDGGDQQDEGFIVAAETIGFPILVKASAGGGGKGMHIVRTAAALPDALASARRSAQRAFGDGSLLLERFVESPRHIEVQILGDAYGTVVHCFERECSIQRRHQKIIEEAPSPALDEDQRAAITEAALRAGRALGYQSAGTVEFILAPDGTFYFLEVNTRLQVEHPVTEAITGLDLVQLQIQIARGERLPVAQADIKRHGHAIEARIYAEDPAQDFLPQAGQLVDWWFPEVVGLRLDSGVEAGDRVPMHYDPMLAKAITWGETRSVATKRLI